jgi:hypothetical protein
VCTFCKLSYYLPIKHVLFSLFPVSFGDIRELKQWPSLLLATVQLSLPKLVKLNTFHTIYLRTMPFRLNARLRKFSSLPILHVLTFTSLRWPLDTRSLLRLNAYSLFLLICLISFLLTIFPLCLSSIHLPCFIFSAFLSSLPAASTFLSRNSINYFKGHIRPRPLGHDNNTIRLAFLTEHSVSICNSRVSDDTSNYIRNVTTNKKYFNPFRCNTLIITRHLLHAVNRLARLKGTC